MFIKGIIALAVFTFISAFVGGGYLWLNSVLRESAEKSAAIAKATLVMEALERAIANRDEAIDRFVAAQKETNAALAALQKNQEVANAEVRKVRDVLSQHDLVKLSLAKPLLIERRINAGSARIAKLLSAATVFGKRSEAPASSATSGNAAAPASGAVPRAKVPGADTGDDEDAD